MPGFECLEEIAKRFGVDVVAFGSLVRRLAVHQINYPSQELDLFKLVPFLSDIDIYHTGDAKLTSALRAEIIGRVPFSEYFRWQIFSEGDLAEYRRDEAHLPLIPVNKLTLSVRDRGGICDPFDGMRDIAHYSYRFLPSPYYAQSALRQSHRDCPALHALLYFQAMCEDERVRDPSEQPGWRACCDFLKGSDPVSERESLKTRGGRRAAAVSFEENPWLRARIHYRLHALIARCRSTAMMSRVLQDSGLEEVLINTFQSFGPPWVWYDALPFFTERVPVFAIGCRLGGDQFRVSRVQTPDQVEHPPEVWANVRKSCMPLKGLMQNPLPELGEHQWCVGVSPRIWLRGGSAPSDGGNEPVNVQFEVTPWAELLGDAYKENQLGVLTLLQASEGDAADSETHGCILSLPATAEIVSFHRGREPLILAQVGISTGRVLAVFGELLKELRLEHLNRYSLRFFLIRYQPPDEFSKAVR